MRSAKQLLVWLILLLFLLLWFAPPSLAAPDQEQEIKRNIEIYKSPSYSLKERGDAIRRLMEIGQPAIPALIQALKDEKVRYTATSTLGEIGPAAQDAVPAMVAAFRKADQFDRGNAASALLKIVRPEKNMDQAALQHKILQLQNLREAIFKDFSEPPYKDLRDQLDLMYLQEKQPPAWVAWVEKHKLQQKWWAWAVAGYAVLLILCLPTWLLLLWLQPLWLYWLNEKVSSWSFKAMTRLSNA